MRSRSSDRPGIIVGRLDLFPNPNSGLDVIDETHEGVAMDNDANLYVVSEDGAGPNDPELEVYAPESPSSDMSPTAVTLNSNSGTLPSTTTTANGPVKLTGLSITDADGIGTDSYTVSATDANGDNVSNLFEADHTGLYLASGASLANVPSPVTLKVSVSDTGSTDPSSVVMSGAFTLTVKSEAPSRRAGEQDHHQRGGSIRLGRWQQHLWRRLVRADQHRRAAGGPHRLVRR